MPIILTVSYCFVVAGIAEVVGLAPIVGAFAAGLVLDSAHYQGYASMRERKIEELLARLNALIRRAAGYASPVIEEGGLKLDTAKKEVRVNDLLVEAEFSERSPTRARARTPHKGPKLATGRSSS